MTKSNIMIGSKRSYSQSSMIEADEYEQMLHSLNQNIEVNEYDRYVSTPRDIEDIDTLTWWRKYGDQYPHLRLQVCDTLAVTPTGAGVEHQFSKSRKVATPERWMLSANRLPQVIMVKDFLERKRRPIKITIEGGLSVQHILIESDDYSPLKEWRNKWWESRLKQGNDAPTRKKARE